MKKRASGIIALLLSLLVLAGCTGQGNAPHEYVAVYTNSALFINWAETNNKLTGQLQQGFVDNNTLAVTSENYSFNGVLNGADISITLSNGITMTGTLSKNVLTLLYPANDGTGTMATIAFKPGSVTEFNTAIGNFQNQKNEKDASDTAQKKEKDASDTAQKKEKDASDTAQKKEKDASDTLSSSLATINEDASQAATINFDSNMTSFESDLKKMQSDYQKLLSDASVRPLTSDQLNGTLADDLNGTLADDLNGTLADDLNGTLADDLQSAKALYSQLGNDITKLQQNWKIYQSLNISDSLVSADAVPSASGAAQKQQATLSQRISVAQKQGDAYYSQGEKIYQTASKYVSGLTVSGSN
jgi:hypothetical protein